MTYVEQAIEELDNISQKLLCLIVQLFTVS